MKISKEKLLQIIKEEVSEAMDPDLVATGKHQTVEPFPPGPDGSQAQRDNWLWALLTPEEKRWVLQRGGTPEALEALRMKQADPRSSPRENK